MKVYRDGELKAVYSISKGDRVEFSDDFPFPDDYNGHEYVDLGLHSGLKWATCNVGASSPEETGDFFAWGESEPKETYEWSNYIWCNGSSDTMTKYCNSSNYGSVDDKTVLDPEDDAAQVHWGEAWRMPTREELNELLENYMWLWSTKNGVDGYKVVGRNGNSIFLPAAGDMYADRLWDESGSVNTGPALATKIAANHRTRSATTFGLPLVKIAKNATMDYLFSLSSDKYTRTVECKEIV